MRLHEHIKLNLSFQQFASYLTKNLFKHVYYHTIVNFSPLRLIIRLPVSHSSTLTAECCEAQSY